MKVLLFFIAVPAIISTFGLWMAGHRAKEILIERYGENVEEYYSHNRIDTIMSLAKFAIIILIPFFNIAVAAVSVFGYEDIRDRTVEKVAAEVERNLYEASKNKE